jgi:phosphoglycerate dehydrogenase-like enzyme
MPQQRVSRPRIAVLYEEASGRPPGLEPLENEAHLVFCHDVEGLRQALREADILLVTDFRRPLVSEGWSAGKRLQWIHAASAGVDTVLTDEVRRSGVPVTNARGIFEEPIAEHVLGTILAFAKDLLTTVRLQTERRWLHRETEALRNRQALIVGAGAIGSRVGQRLQRNGMSVHGVSREARAEDPVFGRVHAATKLREWLPKVDYVVITAPLTGETRGLFGPREFQLMKRTGRIINVGRGPIVQTAALVEALEHGEIAGAALDTFETEPLPSDHPLWDIPTVIITAHMAGDVIGWREALSAQFHDNFERWRRGEPLLNRVQ